MNNLSQLIYHPGWEEAPYNRKEYKKIINKLASKDLNSSFIYKDHTLQIAGPIMSIWLKIKGWLGFENQIDPIKVHYQFLKFLRQGAVQNYFSDEKIQKSIAKLGAVLNREPPFRDLSSLIQHLFNGRDKHDYAQFCDQKVREYYRLHKHDLHAGLLENFLEKYLHPIQQNSAAIQYNFAKINAEEGRLDEAMRYLKAAIVLAPNQYLWQIFMAEIFLMQAKLDWEISNVQTARDLCNEGLKTLLSIQILDQKKGEPLRNRLTIARAVLDQLLGHNEELAHLIRNQTIPLEQFVPDYEKFLNENPSLTPSEEQRGNFYMMITPSLLNQKKGENSTINKALDAFQKSKEEGNLQVIPKMVQVHLLDFEWKFKKGQIDQAAHVLEKVYPLLREQLEGQSRLQSQHELNQFRSKAEQLIEHDGSKAFFFLQLLKQLYQAEPEKCSVYCTLLVNLHRQYSQWQEAEKYCKELIEIQPSMQTYLTASEIYEKLKLPEKAVYYAERAVALKPDGMEASLRLLELTGDAGATQKEKQLELFTKFIEQHPDHFNAHLHMGELYLEQGNLYDAEIHLLKAESLLKETNNRILTHALAELYKRIGNPLKALQYYKVLHGVDHNVEKDLISCHIELADSATKNDDPAEALEHWMQVQNLSPSFQEYAAEKIAECGLSLEKKGNFQTARKGYEKLLSHPGSLSKKELARIRLFLAEQQPVPSLAVSYLKDAQALDPQNARILNQLGKLYIDTDQYSLAEPIYQDLTHLETDKKQRPYFTLAEIQYKNGDYSKALASYRQAENLYGAECQTQILDCLHRLGKQAMGKKEYAQALLHLKELFALSSTSEQKMETARLLLDIGETLKNSRHQQDAFDAFKLSLQYWKLNGLPSDIQSKAISAYMHLASHAEGQGNPADAAEFYEEILKLHPENGPANYHLAELKYHLGEIEQSLTHFQKAAFSSKTNVQYNERLAQIELQIGNRLYEKGEHNSEQIRQELIQFIDQLYASQHGQKIIQSLGKSLGIWSTENAQIKSLARKPCSPFETELAVLEAFELLKRSFNGTQGHPTQQQMPAELVELIFAQEELFNQKIDLVKFYYNSMQKELNKLIEFAQESPVRQYFVNWKGPVFKTLKDAPNVMKDTQQILSKLQELEDSGTKLSKQLQKQKNYLKQYLAPHIWTAFSIPHYQKALEMNAPWGEYCNRLIDAYVKTGEYAQAIQTFELVKKKFPAQPAFINSTVYTLIAKDVEQCQTIGFEKVLTQLLKNAQVMRSQGDTEKSLNMYQSALSLASNQQQRIEICSEIIHLVDLYMNESPLKAAEAYEIIFPFIDELKIPPKKRAWVLYTLVVYGQTLQISSENTIALLDQAVKLLPKEPLFHAAKGDAYLKQNKIDSALSCYRESHQLNAEGKNSKNQKVVDQLIFCEQTVADALQLRGDTETLRHMLLDFVQMIQNSEESKKIAKALQSFLGFTSQYSDLSKVGKTRQIEAVLTDAKRVIKIVTDAYDGKRNHMQLAEMPRKFSLEKQRIFQKTTQLEQKWQQQQNSMQIEDFEKHTTAQSMYEESLKHYQEAFQLSKEKYGVYCNQLIDVHVKLQQFDKALFLYNNFKTRFPHDPCHIDPNVFIHKANEYMKRNKYDEAIDYLKKCIDEHPNESQLRKALSDLYFKKGKYLLAQGSYYAAFASLKNTLELESDLDGDVYASFADIYSWAYKQGRDLTSQQLHPSPYIYLDKIAEYRKKAADLAPNSAESQYALGKFLYFNGGSPLLNANFKAFRAIDYLKKAFVLNPNHIPIVSGYLKAIMNEFGDKHPDFEHVGRHLLSIGGKITEDYWENELSDDS